MSRNFPFWSALLGVGATALLVTGCPARELSEVPPIQDKEELKDIPVEVNRDIDILFVIDNSLSMDEEQDSLVDNFPLLIQVLESIEGGLPNVHIGVVSSDVGTGQFPTCTELGDEGRLQVDPRIDGCSPPADAFIEDIADTAAPDGRRRNYSASLGATFQCIAALGTSGCGFEQHLESMRQALDGSQPFNDNFIRPDAYLAVIFIADEDDCSAADDRVFDNQQDSIEDPLGALESFRCFEFGVKCDGEVDIPSERAFGPRSNCVPDPESAYMYEIEEYVTFLKGLKADPSLVIVAGIIGNVTPVAVGPDDDNPEDPALVPSCESGAGEAAPGIRLKAFLDAFPQRNTFTTICNENLSDALLLIAELLKEVLGNPCLTGNLVDKNPNIPDIQPECQVSDVRFPGTDNQTEDVLAKCNGDQSNKPCWHLEIDASCSETPTGLALFIERTEPAEPGTHVQARCVTAVAPPAE